MKIVRPYMKMLTTGFVELAGATLREVAPLAFTNWCGRISHRSEDAEKQDIERFLRFVVLEKGDWSITEHVSVSVDAVVDRGITHEIVRHRIASYTQESTRFVNYAKKMPPSFIYPIPEVECLHCLAEEVTPHHCIYNSEWRTAIYHAEKSYQALLAAGWRPQEARSVFPNALASRIVITMNLRTWRHFFLMRTSVEAHPQMRQVTIPLLAEFKKTIPVLYEDIEPNAKQSENLKMGR